MPYKDSETRRRYDREYKKHRRAMSVQHKAGVRAYICHRYPNLRLRGGISFHECLLVTDDPVVQDLVEQSLEYGQVIFQVALVP